MSRTGKRLNGLAASPAFVWRTDHQTEARQAFSSLQTRGLSSWTKLGKYRSAPKSSFSRSSSNWRSCGWEATNPSGSMSGSLRPQTGIFPKWSQQGTDDHGMIQVRGLMTWNQAREHVERKLLTHELSIRKTTREVAGLLGVDHSTVVRKIKKYGLRVEQGA